MPVTSPSFLENVLTVVGGEFIDLNVKVRDLEKSIELLQIEAHHDIVAKYDEYDEVAADGNDNIIRAQRLMVELKDAGARIAAKVNCNLDKSMRNVRSLHESVQEAEAVLSGVEHLLLIDNAIQNVSKAHSEQKFLEAAVYFSDVKPMFNRSTSDSESLKLLQLLKKEFLFCGEMLKASLHTLWSKCVFWKDLDLYPNLQSIALCVSKSQVLLPSEIIKALYLVDFLDFLSMFGDHLMKDVLKPITSCVTTVEENRFQDHAQLSVRVISVADPPIDMVVENVAKVMEFLEAELDIQESPEYSFISIIGKQISSKYLTEFLKALFGKLGRNDEELDVNFKVIYNFLVNLNVIGFLPPDSLLEATEKLKRSCAAFMYHSRGRVLEEARSIMKKDIHDKILIPENSSNSFSGVIENGCSEQDTTLNSSRASGSFVFHSCRVSKWIVELVDLIRKLLKDTGNEHIDSQFQIVRSVVNQYLTIVPLFHREAIETQRLQVALFYNNCMFLTHHLVLLGFECQKETDDESILPQLASVDLIEQLRTLAISSLLKYLQKERTSLVEATKDFDLAELSKNRAEFEESVKKCMRQVEKLHSVWKHIFADDMYPKLIGGLVNSWFEGLIVLVISASHIPDPVARILVEIFKSIVERTQKLFTVPGDLTVHVTRWNRFNTLIDVLGITLTEIDIKWKSGAFSRDFRVDQVQTLIRARFKDAEALPAVLACLK